MTISISVMNQKQIIYKLLSLIIRETKENEYKHEDVLQSDLFQSFKQIQKIRIQKWFSVFAHDFLLDISIHITMKIFKKPCVFSRFASRPQHIQTGYIYFVGHVACADIMIPTITPNNPRALPKISITRIFTKSVEF